MDAEVGMLSDVRAGAYQMMDLTAAEVASAISLIERCSDRNLGIADATNVVLAARFKTRDLLSLEERDYRIVRRSGARRSLCWPPMHELGSRTRRAWGRPVLEIASEGLKVEPGRPAGGREPTASGVVRASRWHEKG